MSKSAIKIGKPSWSLTRDNIHFFEADAAGRRGVLCAEAPLDNAAEVFSAMGASRIELYDGSSRALDWSYLVKVRGQWRFAFKERCQGLWRYFISADEILSDPCADSVNTDIESTLRDLDPDYFFSGREL